VAFALLPDTWKCPVCGAPKSAYKSSVTKSGEVVWSHEHDDIEQPNSTAAAKDAPWVCSICNHVYDAAKDGNGVAFTLLPDTWKCPVCGAPKSAYKQSLTESGEVVWSHEH